METPTADGLTFRRMTHADLDVMYSLLGDPEVMRHYDHPKSRGECQGWIDWNQRNYARDGFGLWIIETANGDFVGDCGLTWQPIDGESLELGYHVLPRHQGRGLATVAAQASLDFARARGVNHVIAIIAPSNVPSARVAEKAGLTYYKDAVYHGVVNRIYRAELKTV
jgi:RimJ/RimL family protein N-acetyltransferase